MPLKTKPEDEPGIVRFHMTESGEQLQVRCEVPPQEEPPFRSLGGAPIFPSTEAFKQAAIKTGLTPAVAEDRVRSFNATARQLMQLGFTVQLTEKAS